MFGIAYYWRSAVQKSCTVRSKQQNTIPVAEPTDETFLDTHCRDGTESFIGCIYETQQLCKTAVGDPEFIGVVSPEKLRVSMSIYIEIKGGDDESSKSKDDAALNTMNNAVNGGGNTEPEAGFGINMRISLAEFSFEFADVKDNVRLCSDELFNLASMIPGLSDDTTLKFCLRATKWKTFMPANGEIYASFTPKFSATVRKASSSSSIGFSGGIEYTADDWVAFVSLVKPTDWIDKPNEYAMTRQDLKWFKPITVRSRNEYEDPPNLTMIAIAIFVGLIGIVFTLKFKKYVGLRNAELSFEELTRQRKEDEEIEAERHRLWEQNVTEQEEQYQAKLAGRADKLLDKYKSQQQDDKDEFDNLLDLRVERDAGTNIQ